MHPEVVETVRALHGGSLRLPQEGSTHVIPITTLRALGTRGLIHRDIDGVERPAEKREWGSEEATVKIRGPFDIVSVQSPEPTFPVLWGHAADRECSLVVEPDREGRVREGAADKATDVWRTARRLHFSLDFRLNSQSLAACLTRMSTLGGRAWPNFLMTELRHETVTVLWANTTLCSCSGGPVPCSKPDARA